MAAGDQHIEQHHPLALIGLAFTGILAGAVLGALTNGINGCVSPLYFCNILGWHDVADVWRASIAQGIFEGLLLGLFLALVFTIVIGCVFPRLGAAMDAAMSATRQFAFASVLNFTIRRLNT